MLFRISMSHGSIVHTNKVFYFFLSRSRQYLFAIKVTKVCVCFLKKTLKFSFAHNFSFSYKTISYLIYSLYEIFPVKTRERFGEHFIFVRIKRFFPLTFFIFSQIIASFTIDTRFYFFRKKILKFKHLCSENNVTFVILQLDLMCIVISNVFRKHRSFFH